MLLSAAFVYACTLTDVTGVSVGQVTIHPALVTLIEGATVQLQAQAKDQFGGQIPVGAVTWSVDDPSLVSISGSGLLQAFEDGQTTVRATLEGVTGSAPVTVDPGPSIGVDRSSISFLGAFGGTPPLPTVVQISNVEGGTLGGLSAAVEYEAGGPAGWLNLALSGTTAPASLTVSTSVGALEQGAYEATISLSSPLAKNTPLTIPVQLQMILNQPWISIHPDSLDFLVKEGGNAPVAQSVEVANVGGGILTDLTVFVPQVSWLPADLSGTTAPANLHIQPDPTGLSAGTYEEAVLVRSPAALNDVEVYVRLKVLPPPRADLAVNKSGPARATVGDTVVFLVRVTNNGPDEARAVTLTDSVPPGLTLVRASGNPAVSGRAVSWNLGLLDPGTSSTDSVWAIAETQGVLTNLALASATSEEARPGDERATHELQVAPLMANLLVQKSGPANASYLDTIRYEVTVLNGGPNKAEDVVLTDSLPAGVTFLSASGTPSVAGRRLSWVVGELESGEGASETIEVRVDATGVKSNVALTSTSTFDPVSTNNRASVSTAIGALADLSLTKTGPAVALAGDTITYLISVSNAGPDEAVGATVLDSLPNGMEFVSATQNGVQVSQGGVSWSFHALPSGGTKIFSLTGVAPVSGDLTNVATVFSGTPDPSPADNVDTSVTTVRPSADLSIEKKVEDSVTAGEQATYTITVFNDGPSDAIEVVLTDTLPAGVKYATASGNPTVVGQAVTWPAVATLAAGASQDFTLTVDVASNASANLTNVARVSSPSDDEVSGNPNRVELVSGVRVKADVVLSMDGPNSSLPGGQITYEFTVDNLGPSDATGLVVTDPIPAGVSWVSATGGGTYELGSGIVTWSLGDLTAAGRPIIFSLTVQVGAGTAGIVTDFAELTSTSDDPNTPNQAIWSTSVSGANLFVTKTAPSTAIPGDSLSYSIRVENGGPNSAVGVEVTDTLPLGVTYVSDTGGGTLEVEVGPEGLDVLTWTLATLPSDASQGFTVNVTVDSDTSGKVTNVAAATSETDDGDLSDNRTVASTTIIPEAPSALTATASSSTQMDLAWTDASTNENGFSIERCTGPSCTAFAELTTVAAGTEAYTDGTVAENTTYAYRVRAYNGGGQSAYSNEEEETTPVAAPSALTVTGTTTSSASLGWADNSAAEDAYAVERCAGTAAACDHIAFTEITAAVPANATTYTDNTAAASTTYTYRVRAISTAGVNSVYSNEIEATTLTPPPPAKPSGLTATAVSDTQIDLVWTDASSNEDGFRIQRCSGSSATCKNRDFSQIDLVSQNVSTYTDGSVVENTTYSYRIRAYNTGGDSGFSREAEGTTPVTAPSALTVTGTTPSSVSLSWVDNSAAEDGYAVERCAGTAATCDDVAFTEITAAVPANATTFIDNTGAAGTTYTYRVRALSAGGVDSAYSNEAEGTTGAPPSPPPERTPR